MIHKLEAIGYLAGSRRAPKTINITVHDPERAWPGYNMCTSGHESEVTLIDMEGQQIHRWSFDGTRLWPDIQLKRGLVNNTFWRRTFLLEDGSLLGIYEGLGLIKIDRNSQLIWARHNKAHHDLEITPTVLSIR